VNRRERETFYKEIKKAKESYIQLPVLMDNAEKAVRVKVPGSSKEVHLLREDIPLHPEVVRNHLLLQHLRGVLVLNLAAVEKTGDSKI